MGLSLEEAVEKQRQLEHKVTKSSYLLQNRQIQSVLFYLRPYVHPSSLIRLFLDVHMTWQSICSLTRQTHKRCRKTQIYFV